MEEKKLLSDFKCQNNQLIQDLQSLETENKIEQNESHVLLIDCIDRFSSNGILYLR